MATEKEMYELIGRAVADAEFRQKMMADPEEAAKEAGYTLTTEQLTALKSAAGKGLAAVLDERLPKSVGLEAGPYP
jgi:hypothetical protein